MIASRLQKKSSFVLSIYAIVAAFGTYFCMYAFRKPFTVATFESAEQVWNIDYKILLIIAQVLGYTLSKFIGIKVISEMTTSRRAFTIIGLIGIAELALLGFAFSPVPLNIFFLFLNGLPLGMIWGLVFSYLEGRQTTEVLGAGLSISFIISSGAVKSVGLWLMTTFGVSEFMMPFLTGAIFIIPLLVFTFLLEQLPPPNEKDVIMRSKRQPMTPKDRIAFFQYYAPGLVLLIVFYILLTAYRDFRDNFAVEIWSSLGFVEAPAVFTLSELPIALIILISIGATMFIRNNRRAFMTYLWVIAGGAALVGGSTFLFQMGAVPGALWMVLVGLGLFTAYVPFNCILFERLVAIYRNQANAGFLIYVADAFGYLGSVSILLYKNFVDATLSWEAFFVKVSYWLCFIGLLSLMLAILYFKFRGEQRIPKKTALNL